MSKKLNASEAFRLSDEISSRMWALKGNIEILRQIEEKARDLRLMASAAKVAVYNKVPRFVNEPQTGVASGKGQGDAA